MGVMDSMNLICNGERYYKYSVVVIRKATAPCALKKTIGVFCVVITRTQVSKQLFNWLSKE